MGSERLFLCVDCGGSKTSAVLVDRSGSVVGRGLGGPSNFIYAGMDAFLRSVKTAVEAALEQASNSKVSLPVPSLLVAAWFGISGCDQPANVVALQSPLSALLSLSVDQLVIGNDTHLLASPLSSHPHAKSAVVVIAGTGSNCVSFKRREGAKGGLEELSRSGGWGWVLGDEGSGFHAGRTAMQDILSRWDRESLDSVSTDVSQDITTEVNPLTGKPTLRARIFSHFDIAAPPDLFSVVYAANPPPLHPSGGASSNAPPPSPGPVALEVATTTSVSADTSLVDNAKSSPPSGSGTDANSSTINPKFHLLECKHRLSSLTPLIFSSAFDDGDPDALRVLRTCARALAEHVNNLMVRSDSGFSTSKAVRPEETLLCFGGSLVGIKKYRALVVDELGRIRSGASVGTGEADDRGEDEGRGVVAGVVFVGDAAVSGAVGLASGFAG